MCLVAGQVPDLGQDRENDKRILRRRTRTQTLVHSTVFWILGPGASSQLHARVRHPLRISCAVLARSRLVLCHSAATRSRESIEQVSENRFVSI